jgi:hypothetical protein
VAGVQVAYFVNHAGAEFPSLGRVHLLPFLIQRRLSHLSKLFNEISLIAGKTIILHSKGLPTCQQATYAKFFFACSLSSGPSTHTHTHTKREKVGEGD